MVGGIITITGDFYLRVLEEAADQGGLLLFDLRFHMHKGACFDP